MQSSRRLPNILITGTPGTGKSTLADLAASSSGLRCINVGDWVKEKELHSGWDEEFQSFILDEDKVCDALEDTMVEGGNIVDHHSCDYFPERWFDLVVVLQADNSVLYDRLQQRGYSQRKVEENLECEIMMVVLEEAHESYKSDIIVALRSDTPEDMEKNAELLSSYIQQYRAKAGG